MASYSYDETGQYFVSRIDALHAHHVFANVVLLRDAPVLSDHLSHLYPATMDLLRIEAKRWVLSRAHCAFK
jgi:hypothetical protein